MTNHYPNYCNVCGKYVKSYDGVYDNLGYGSTLVTCVECNKSEKRSIWYKNLGSCFFRKRAYKKE